MGESETILVVEDDRPLRDMVGHMLQGAGYRVVAAKNVETALDIVKACNLAIDLLLTDAVMPGKGGTELLEEVKVIRPEIHSLLMSGYTGELVTLRVGVGPETAFVEKPFTDARCSGKFDQHCAASLQKAIALVG
jgi:DNA-binding NtrC family response regulator